MLTCSFYLFRNFKTKLLRKHEIRTFSTENVTPLFTDVLIIGGGAIGSSSAYWITQKAAASNKNLKVLVVEKDLTYQKCSTALSVGGIRQQFSIAENIKMSLFGADFIKNIKKRFGDDADVCYKPNGYLTLASEKGVNLLKANFQLQEESGAKHVLLSQQQLKTRFPWLNVENVEIGCLGGETEGWFDPWSMLTLLKKGAVKNKAQYIQGNVIQFLFNSQGQPEGVVVENSKEQNTIKFKSCVIACGAESGNVARLAKIGTGDGDLSIALPVERRKRYVYRFNSQSKEAPPPSSPLLIDYSGVYFRNDGASYVCGSSPNAEDEPCTDNLDVDYSFFDKCVWPRLATRVPPFESIKVKSAWAGYYDFNTFDKNAIIGPHSCYPNIYFATGFSGHGIQQSPAAGLAVAELILDGRFSTIDLCKFSFDRLITQTPVQEIVCI